MSGEIESWRTTVMVLAAVSFIVGIIQRTHYMFLDPKFEVCVFHIPTILSLIIYSRLLESSKCKGVVGEENPKVSSSP